MRTRHFAIDATPGYRSAARAPTSVPRAVNRGVPAPIRGNRGGPKPELLTISPAIPGNFYLYSRAVAARDRRTSGDRIYITYIVRL